MIILLGYLFFMIMGAEIGYFIKQYIANKDLDKIKEIIKEKEQRIYILELMGEFDYDIMLKLTEKKKEMNLLDVIKFRGEIYQIARVEQFIGEDERIIIEADSTAKILRHMVKRGEQ